MIAALILILNVCGGEVWLLFWILCTLLYFGICCIFKFNRNKSSMKNILIWFIAAGIKASIQNRKANN